MSEIVIEQAVAIGTGPGAYQVVGRSAGLLDDWAPEVLRTCDGFGARHAGVKCPGCVFAQPFGKLHVAVVQVADQGTEPVQLGFRFLVIPRKAYALLMGDPFRVAERYPPLWHQRGELQSLAWPAEPLPWRTVEETQKVLKRPESPALLGGVQVLVDGGRVVFQRPEPDQFLIPGLWSLLPNSNRCELWPASFAFGNQLGFHALVVPHVDPETFVHYVNEDQAEHYPEGRYELALQIAVEAGDQAELDGLFTRRSRAQVWRLGLALLVMVVVLALASKLLMPGPKGKDRPRGSAPAKTELKKE